MFVRNRMQANRAIELHIQIITTTNNKWCVSAIQMVFSCQAWIVGILVCRLLFLFFFSSSFHSTITCIFYFFSYSRSFAYSIAFSPLHNRRSPVFIHSIQETKKNKNYGVLRHTPHIINSCALHKFFFSSFHHHLLPHVQTRAFQQESQVSR